MNAFPKCWAELIKALAYIPLIGSDNARPWGAPFDNSLGSEKALFTLTSINNKKF